jgi:hypothetical protein
MPLTDLLFSFSLHSRSTGEILRAYHWLAGRHCLCTDYLLVGSVLGETMLSGSEHD